MDLMIVRHSISQGNHGDMISGADHDVPLSDRGIVYAKTVSQLYDWQQYQAVYASPLIRAQQTAQLLVGADHPIITDKRIEEVHFGDWDGKEAGPFRKQYPQAFDYSGMFSDQYSDYAPNAESYAAVIARCDSFINDLKRNHPTDKVLVVCHGLTIRALMAVLFRAPISEYHATANLSMNEVHLEADHDFRPRLLSYNRTLAPQPPLKAGDKAANIG